MFGEKTDNFLAKWPVYREAILKLGKVDNSAVKELVKTFENGNGK